ncbi:MAG: PIN domain-containing protein [Nanoarchaeota archaeon]|nr:PIN domain-containing protein [Nanoarchaeota archaeon]
MDRIYCDTCIYIDLFEGRKDRFRDLGDFALRVFNLVKDNKYMLVVSDWILDEIRKYANENKKPAIIGIMADFLRQFEKQQILQIERTKGDEQEARKLSQNYPDALHVVLAKKSNAIYFVTRNVQDFAEFRSFIEVVFPESL